jgi:hypothetical protein
MEERNNKPAFEPRWKEDSSNSQELVQREGVMKLFHSLAKPHCHTRYINGALKFSLTLFVEHPMYHFFLYGMELI